MEREVKFVSAPSECHTCLGCAAIDDDKLCDALHVPGCAFDFIWMQVGPAPEVDDQ